MTNTKLQTNEDLTPPYVCKDIEPVTSDITIDDCVYRTYTWNAPSDNWKGRILFVHGYRDSHYSYMETGETFAKAGFDFFYYYQRGEGDTKSVHGNGNVANDHYAYKGVDDFIRYNLEYLEKQGLPPKLHLMGHSMGGGIVLNYACDGEFKDKVLSYSTIGPLVTLHAETDPGKPIEFVVRTICLLGGKNLRVNSPLKVEYIAGDEKYQKFLQENAPPNGLNGAFVETRDMILRGRNLLNKSKFSSVDKEIPMLLCHGDADYINDKEGSKKWHESLNSIGGVANKEIIIYKEGRHNLFIDKEHIKQKVFTDIIAFLNKNS